MSPWLKFLHNDKTYVENNSIHIENGDKLEKQLTVEELEIRPPLYIWKEC